MLQRWSVNGGRMSHVRDLVSLMEGQRSCQRW